MSSRLFVPVNPSQSFIGQLEVGNFLFDISYNIPYLQFVFTYECFAGYQIRNSHESEKSRSWIEVHASDFFKKAIFRCQLTLCDLFYLFNKAREKSLPCFFYARDTPFPKNYIRMPISSVWLILFYSDEAREISRARFFHARVFYIVLFDSLCFVVCLLVSPSLWVWDGPRQKRETVNCR